MKRILSALLASLLLGAGLTVGVAGAASAHTGDLNATAICNTETGEFDVTYTLAISQTGLTGSTKWRVGTTSFEGTPSSNAGLDRGPVASSGAGTITLGTYSVPGSSTQAPWAYAYTTWSDNFKKGSDGGDIALSGDCEQYVEPDVAKADWGFTPAACAVPQTFVLGDISNATWDASATSKVGASGPAEFDITATLNENAQWAEGQTGSWHVVLSGPDSSACPTVQECTSYSSNVTTDLSTWDLSSTSTDGSGHQQLAESSLHVWTDASGHRKAAGYYPASFALADVGGFTLDWTGTSPAPGGQLVVDLDNNGTADGTLVIESVYGGIQWLSVPAGGTWVSRADSPHVAGGGGYPNQGTFNDWLTTSPNAQVLAIGYSLGSGVTGDGNITKISTGCVDYTFALLPLPATETGNDVTESTDCTTELVTITTTPWSITYSYDSNQQPVAGDKVYGDPVVTTREATAAELNAAECPPPHQPDPIVTVVTTEQEDCEASEVTVTTTTTTTAYVYEAETRTWALGEPVVTVASSTRPLTVGEREACAGDKPDPLRGETSINIVDCNADTFNTTTSSWVAEYELVGTNWVLGERVYSDPVTVKRPATDAELIEAKCITPVTPIGTIPPAALASTGSQLDPAPWIIGAGIILLGLSAVLLVTVRRRRSE